MSGWEGYVYLVQHKYDIKKGEYLKTNLCQHAAIYGTDGTAWAVSSDWPGLNEYVHSMEADNGGQLQVPVNEFKCVMGAAQGQRMPSQAGVRMGNEKYIFTKHDPELQSTYLSRAGGGGAVISRLKGGVVIGIWHKEIQMSKGGTQNQFDCAQRVEETAQMLREKGY